MSGAFSYRKLVVYQHSRKFVKTIYLLLRGYPAEEKYALCDQMRRAVVSIPSNIAEGMGRFSDKDKLHFIEFAYGSLHEILSQLELSLDLGYINELEFQSAEEEAINIAKLLSGLRSSIENRM